MTDHGEAGGTSEPRRAIRPRVSSGTKGGRSQGGVKGSSRSDEAGDCTNWGFTSLQGITGEDERLQASSWGRAGGLAELCGKGKLNMTNDSNSTSLQVDAVSLLS